MHRTVRILGSPTFSTTRTGNGHFYLENQIQIDGGTTLVAGDNTAIDAGSGGISTG